MKKIRDIYILPLILMGMLIILTNSCKKNVEIIAKGVDITWENPLDIIVGTALNATQLNATANVAGTFVYTPAIGTVLSLGANQILKVNFIPTDAVNYSTSTKTVQITVVAKNNPVINWVSPADITLGTALSSNQLNATANVPGTFVYTPAVGTVLTLGTAQNLKVDFTPTDAVNYSSATKTVQINIINATVTDIDGNVYNTVKIGTQVWMSGNLKTTKYRDGSSIPNVTDNTAWRNLTTGAYSNYNNLPSNSTTYGKLYNWYAISDTRNIAPAGWHVATDTEWSTLIAFLGGELVAGDKLKEIGTTHWISPNTGATNEKGFTALPSGVRVGDGTFNRLSTSSFWWTAYDGSGADPSYRFIHNEGGGVIKNPGGKVIGISVRCVKD